MHNKALWFTVITLALAALVMVPYGDAATAKGFSTAAIQPSDTTTVILDFGNISGVQNHPLFMRLIDQSSGIEAARVVVDSVTATDIDVPVHGVGVGRTYVLEFFSDQNNNRKYDGSPTDRAWRMNVGPVIGSEEILVPAGLAETTIIWPYTVTVNLAGMTPVKEKRMEFRLVDRTSGMEVTRAVVDSVKADSLTVVLPGAMTGQNYWLEFWADMNENGKYDGLSVDQSWRIPVDNIQGDTIIAFQYNTTFTPLQWPNLLTLELQGMTPNLGQKMFFRLVRADSAAGSPAGKEVARAVIDSVTADSMFVQLPGLVIGQTYNVDFFADVNKNGKYDAPAVDQAWRINFTDTTGDTTLVFVNNTNFTDIKWPYLVTLNLQNMSELGNHMDFRLVQANSDSEVYRTQIDSVRTANFSVMLPGAQPGTAYRIDFFADVNNNGAYDVPPADHAWRVLLDSTATDTTLVFIHSANYTDIMWPGPVGVAEDNAVPKAFALYQNAPNPFNPSTVITFELPLNSAAKLEVFNIAGQKVRTLVDGKLAPGKYSFTWDGRDSRGTPLSSGVYFYRLKTDTMSKAMRMLLLK